MVNLLLVSHSKQLADGVAELVRQMAPSDSVKILTAAGIGENNEELGTNAVEIMEAITALHNPDGVLVLMDLGSAVLSAEMALDMLEDDLKANVVMCPAPFVEGAIAAGVQANMGSDVQAVYREAMQALAAKNEQVTPPAFAKPAPAPAPADAAPALAAAEGALEYFVTVRNASGLHARPAAMFAKAIGSHKAKVSVTNLSEKKGPVVINGLIAVLLLGAKKGSDLKIQAEGDQKHEVIEALQALFESNFGE